MHRRRIHQQMFQHQVREFLAMHPRDRFPPQPGCRKHVGLIHRSDPAAPALRQARRHAKDALDLVYAVFALIHSSGWGLLFVAEIDPSREFAHHQHIHVHQAFRSQGRGLGQFWVGRDRPQVGEYAQRLAQAQQTLLGPLLTGHGVPLWPPHGTQQDSGRFGAGRFGLGREGIAGRVQRSAADQRFLKVHLEAMLIGQCPQRSYRLGGDFRADPVAGQDDNQMGHARSRS